MVQVPLNDFGLFNMRLCGEKDHKSEASGNLWLPEQG